MPTRQHTPGVSKQLHEIHCHTLIYRLTLASDFERAGALSTYCCSTNSSLTAIPPVANSRQEREERELGVGVERERERERDWIGERGDWLTPINKSFEQGMNLSGS